MREIYKKARKPKITMYERYLLHIPPQVVYKQFREAYERYKARKKQESETKIETCIPGGEYFANGQPMMITPELVERAVRRLTQNERKTGAESGQQEG